MYAERGFTLIEVILTILILGIVSIGLVSAQAVMAARSADPMISRQAIAVAESYFDEIFAKDYLDPVTGTVCPSAPASRALYDNVCDYNGLAGGITDQFGNNSGLLGYSASVSVSPSANLNGLTSSDVLLVSVRVSDPLGHTTLLSGYRVRY